MKKNVFLMTSILVLTMLFSGFTTLNSNENGSNDKIELLKRNGGARSVITTEVFAFIADSIITIEIRNYNGTAWAKIEGLGGIRQQISQINEMGVIILDASDIPSGSYFLYVTLDNALYEGCFEK